jgi:hypothetical protein
MTLPSMVQFNESIKRETMADHDAMNAFSMSYAAMAGIDIQGSNGYDDSNPHVSQLRHMLGPATGSGLPKPEHR